jgi:hypothetical protein
MAIFLQPSRKTCIEVKLQKVREIFEKAQWDSGFASFCGGNMPPPFLQLGMAIGQLEELFSCGDGF